MKNAFLIFSSFVVFGQDSFQPNVLSDQLAALDKEASLVYVQPISVHADEVITPNHEGGFGLAYTRVY